MRCNPFDAVFVVIKLSAGTWLPNDRFEENLARANWSQTVLEY
jgi:hypothetical protein